MPMTYLLSRGVSGLSEWSAVFTISISNRTVAHELCFPARYDADGKGMPSRLDSFHPVRRGLLPHFPVLEPRKEAVQFAAPLDG